MATRLSLTTGIVYLRDLLAGTGSQTYKPSGRLDSDATQAQTGADTDLTTFYTYTVPGGTVDTDGQVLQFWAWGSNGANANTKNYFMGLGAGTLTSRSTAGNATGWSMCAWIIRTSATTGDVFAVTNEGVGNTVAVAPSLAYAITWANNNNFTVKGQNGTATAGDIVYDGSMAVLFA